MASKTKALSRNAATQGNKGTAVIFVHGLGGAPEGTWNKMFACFEGDREFDNWTLDCFHFPTSLLKLPLAPPPPGLFGIADGLRTFIEERHGERGAIHIVAHSLGGLVARQFLVSQFQAGRNNKIDKLALIAVPSNGSALANVGSAVSLRHRQLRRLSRDDEGLRNLNVIWNQLGIEDILNVRYIVGGCDRAVPHDSAVPFHGRDNKSMLINEDHRSIIKPDDQDDIRYQTLRRFLLGTEIATRRPLVSPLPKAMITAVPESSNLAIGAARAANPLFEAYTPKEEPFYVARAFDDVLLQSFSTSHIWVTGESGVGKTSALRRAAYQNGWHLNQVTLAAYEVSTAADLFRAMCVELGSLAAMSEVPAANTPANELFLFLKKILRRFPADLTIANVIEEMPVQADQLVAFAELIAKFLSGLVSESDLYRRVQFAFSSLNEVSNGNIGPSDKSREYIQMIRVDRWPAHDAHRLAALLASTLKPELTERELELLVIAADGSPRFIKQAFRLLRTGACGAQGFEEIIERVQRERIR